MVLIVITRYKLMMFSAMFGIRISITVKELGIFILMQGQIVTYVKIILDIISKKHFSYSVSCTLFLNPG